MQQAQRLSDRTAFLLSGELVETGDTKQIFDAPKKNETMRYVSGQFG